MAKSVVCSESELSVSVNKIIAYIDFLQRQMEQYSRILSAVQRCAIEDDLICAKLSCLEAQVRALTGQIVSVVDTELQAIISEEIAEIEAADNFEYPGVWLGRISALLAHFI